MPSCAGVAVCATKLNMKGEYEPSTQRVRSVSAPLIIVCQLAMLLLGSMCVANAHAWSPERNVELVVPTGPGGSMDYTVRLIHRLFGEMKLLPVSSSVANRGGGEHAVVHNQVMQRAGDPHYLGLATSVLLTSHISGRSAITYTDVTPISLLATEWSVAA